MTQIEDNNDHSSVVLHIFSGDLWAGAEVMVYSLLSKLKYNSDIKVMALCLNEGILYDKLQNSGVETYLISEVENNFLKILLSAYIRFKNQDIKIIHSHRYKENMLAFYLSKLLRVKYTVSTFHGWSVEYFEEGKKIRIATKVDYLILRYFFSKVVAVSQELKTALIHKLSFDEKKIDVIHNGIVIPKKYQQEDTKESDCVHIGTVGRMMPQKGLDLFLEIAEKIKQKNGNVKFSILGDGPLKDLLIKKAISLNIENDVAFLSPRSDPIPYYYSLDLYLNTSRFEGVPLSILEAMACGLPVVAPRVGGIPEIISHGENGFLIEYREADTFSEYCLKLIKDKTLRIDFGKNASRVAVSLYSDSIMAKSYLKLYNSFQSER